MLTVFNKETNEGKTYITQKDDIDLLYACKADSFNKWFESNSYYLEQYLKNKDRFDGGIFTEAYLKIYENILYKGNDITNYKGFFLSSYFRVMLNDNVYQNRFCELVSYNEKDNIDSEYYREIDEANTELERNILEYVYSFYSLQEYELFKMYINLQPAISYKALAKITAQKYWFIQSLVSKITQDIKNNKKKIENREVYNMETKGDSIILSRSYSFSTDYEALWELRKRASHTIICTVSVSNFEYVANMTPNGEIFDSGNCYSNFEGLSKSEFVEECKAINVKYIIPDAIARIKRLKTKNKTK